MLIFYPQHLTQSSVKSAFSTSPQKLSDKSSESAPLCDCN